MEMRNFEQACSSLPPLSSFHLPMSSSPLPITSSLLSLLYLAATHMTFSSSLPPACLPCLLHWYCSAVTGDTPLPPLPACPFHSKTHYLSKRKWAGVCLWAACCTASCSYNSPLSLCLSLYIYVRMHCHLISPHICFFTKLLCHLSHLSCENSRTRQEQGQDGRGRGVVVEDIRHPPAAHTDPYPAWHQDLRGTPPHLTPPIIFGIAHGSGMADMPLSPPPPCYIYVSSSSKGRKTENCMHACHCLWLLLPSLLYSGDRPLPSTRSDQVVWTGRLPGCAVGGGRRPGKEEEQHNEADRAWRGGLSHIPATHLPAHWHCLPTTTLPTHYLPFAHLPPPATTPPPAPCTPHHYLPLHTFPHATTAYLSVLGGKEGGGRKAFCMARGRRKLLPSHAPAFPMPACSPSLSKETSLLLSLISYMPASVSMYVCNGSSVQVMTAA